MKKAQKAGRILPYVIVVIVAVVLVAFVIHLSNTKSRDKKITTTSEKNVIKKKETVTESSNIEEETYENPLNIKLTKLKVNGYKEVNDLVEKYFDAIIDTDTEALKEIFYSESDIDENKLDLDSEYLEYYDNLACYTTNGLEKGTYITYVYYEYKFKDIDELAPGLIRLYIKTNDNGDLYIYNEDFTKKSESLSNDELDYIAEIDSTADAKALIDLVDEELVKARNKDEKLDKFIKELDDLQILEEDSSDEIMTTASTEIETTENETTENETVENETTENETTEESTEESTKEDTEESAAETDTSAGTEGSTAA